MKAYCLLLVRHTCKVLNSLSRQAGCVIDVINAEYPEWYCSVLVTGCQTLENELITKIA